MKKQNINYVESKIDNKMYCVTNGQFTRHLQSNKITYQTYYETYETGFTPLCDCKKSLVFYQHKKSYANSCGDPKCVGKNVSKTKQSWTPQQKKQDSKNKSTAASRRTEDDIKEAQRKTNETCLQRYGVEWPSQTPQQKTKSRKTKLERYGDEYYANSMQTSAAWQAKTDDEIDEIVEKRRETCVARFGVENAFLKPGVNSKAAKNNSNGKDFIMPSGKIIGVRGHEDVVISKLLEYYTEDELAIDDRKSTYVLPTFKYIGYNKREYNYYPDIYISSENKIIEVKGRWWWDACGRRHYEGRKYNNMQKRKAALNAGYNYEVWLFEDKNNYRILSNDSDFA